VSAAVTAGAICTLYARRYTEGMSNRKLRVTVTVDPELVDAGNDAVASGRADSLSGWVTTALAEKVARDAKLAALHDAIAEYEAEFGEITADETATQTRADRKAANVVRGSHPGARTGRPSRTATPS
jgi:ribonuclease HII